MGKSVRPKSLDRFNGKRTAEERFLDGVLEEMKWLIENVDISVSKPPLK